MIVIDYSDKIDGLIVVKEAVTQEEEKELVDAVDARTWSGLGIA